MGQVATEAIIAGIAQPISPLLVPAGHEVAAIGVVDDFYDGDFANVWTLSRSGLSSKTLHAMLSLLFDMGHQLPLANTHSRQGRLIAILASDTPSAGNPIMAHNEGAPALPSLGSAIRRLQAIGHTIASKSGAYNNLGHRGQYAGEGAVHGSWSRLHAFWPRRARVRERARCRPRRLCSSTAASLYRRTSGLDVDGVLCGLEC